MTIYESLAFFGQMFPVRAELKNGKYAKVPAHTGMTGYDLKPYPIQNIRTIAVDQVRRYNGDGIHAFGSAPIFAGCAALDVDNEDAYIELEAMGLDLSGPHVRTPKGGWHFYFKLPKNPSDHVKQSKNAIIKGCDYRCDPFQYIMVPGSVFPDKDGEPKTYSVHDGSLYDAPPMPAELIALLESLPLRGTVEPERLDLIAERTGLEDVVEGVDSYEGPTEYEWAQVLARLEKLKSKEGGSLPLDDRSTWVSAAMTLKYNDRPLSDLARISWPELTTAELEHFYSNLKPRKCQTIGKLIYLIRENGYPGFKPEKQPAPIQTAQQSAPAPTEYTPPEPKPAPPPAGLQVLSLTDKMPVEWFPYIQTDKNGNVKIEDMPENFEAMLKAYGIELWINEMTNKKMAFCPSEDWSDKTWSYIKPCIINLMGSNRIPRVHAADYIAKEVYKNVRHPVKQWLDNLPEWDGKSRLLEVYGTVVTSPDFPIAQKTLYLKKFFLQCIGAIYDKRFQQRGVLVLQGRQSIGKTTWFKSLAPYDKKGFIGDSLTLKNPDSNKDEVMKLLSHWISELGELDRTTRKADIGSIKAFLTAEDDEYRKPYAEEVETYKRKTVIVGTVNNDQFLVDDTGSTRFWAMPVTGFTPLEVDLEQFWAEVKELYFTLLEKKTPYLYWLSPEEDTRREALNDPHQVRSIWEDLMAKYYGQYDGRPENELHFAHAQDIWSAISEKEGRDKPGIVDDYSVRKINRAAESLGYHMGKSKDGKRRGFYLPAMRQVNHD